MTDASGAVVSGAAIVITSTETGRAQSETTDSQGRYGAADLPLGEYSIQAAKEGFSTVVRRGITLSVGSQNVVDFSMRVGQSQQTITVEGEASQVDTASAAVANLVDSTQMRELPLNGRDYSQLLTLAPGVQTVLGTGNGGGVGGGGGSFYGRGGAYSVSGSRAFGQAFLLDDTNIAGFWGNRAGSAAAGTSLGVEAIAEFQTLTNTYSAQFGGSGAVLNAASKSGTNSIHGSAYEFLRNSALDAKNFFDQGSVPPFRRNQFGGSVGGPVKKDKAFFFVNYEGLRQLLGQSVPVFVPDANAHAGFLPIGPGGSLVNVGVDPAVASTLALYPVAPGTTTSGIGRITEVNNQVVHENYLLARMDYTLSPKDSIFFRYVLDSANFVQPSAIPLWPETDQSSNQYATISERRSISPTLINLARISFVRPTERAVVTNSTPPLQFYPGSGLEDGAISISGLSGIGASSTLPFYLVPNRYAASDELFLQKGAHGIHFGVTVEKIEDNTDSPFRAAGQYSFNSLQAFLQDQPNLLFATIPGQADSNRDFRQTLLTPYFQDEWKLMPRLTLNLGLRYEYSTNPTERHDKLNTLVNPPFGTSFQKVPKVFQNNPAIWNFDPRIGLAFDPFGDHKTSIRAGFGMFHDVILSKAFAPGYWLNPPFSTVVAANGQLAALGHPLVYGPVAPNLAFLPPGQLSITQGYLYSANATPYMMQFNFNVQRDLGANTVLTMGYVGSRGVHLWISNDLNPPVPTIDANGTYHYSNFTGGRIVSNARVNPAFGSLNYYDTSGTSNYNSLQANISRRFTSNWQAQASYTWSRSLDTSSIALGLEGSNNGGSGTEGVNNPFCIRCDYGPSSFDRRQNFTVNTVYAFPFKGNKLLEGWQVSGIVTAVTGAPFSITSGFDQQGTGAVLFYQRANLVPGCTASNAVNGSPNQYFKPSCFSLPAIGVPGNLGRDVLTGPSLFNADVALIKDTRIPKVSEVFRVQFRAEFFNVFNHPNFSLPSSSSEFSQISGTPNGAVLGSFGAITNTVVTSRQIQFALKFVF